MTKKRLEINTDISYYTSDGRLTDLSDGKRYNWKNMIEKVKTIGRPLTTEESEEFRIK